MQNKTFDDFAVVLMGDINFVSQCIKFTFLLYWFKSVYFGVIVILQSTFGTNQMHP